MKVSLALSPGGNGMRSRLIKEAITDTQTLADCFEQVFTGPAVPLDDGRGESLKAHGINRQFFEFVTCIDCI